MCGLLWDLVFRVESVGFALGFRVYGLECWVFCGDLGFRFQGFPGCVA